MSGVVASRGIKRKFGRYCRLCAVKTRTEAVRVKLGLPRRDQDQLTIRGWN